MEKLKIARECAAVAALAAVVFLVVRMDLMLGRVERRLSAVERDVRVELAPISAEAKQTATEIRQAATTMRAQADASRHLMADPQIVRGIRLAFGAGDNLNRLVASMERISGRVETRTLPGVEKTVQAVQDTIIDVRNETVPLLAESRWLLEDLRRKLDSDEVRRMLLESAGTLEEVHAIAAGARLSFERLDPTLRDIAGQMQGTLAGTNQTAAGVAKFVEGVNRPRSFKEKLWRAVIYALSFGLPVYLQAR